MSDELVTYGSEVNRREFVRRTGIVGGALLAGPAILNSCTSSSNQTSRSPVGKPRRGGTLRVGIFGGSNADTLDANSWFTTADLARAKALFSPLVTYGPNLEYELVLAESVEPNADASVWTIRLKPGIKFHDGKDLTADDVIFTFDRIITNNLFGSIGFEAVDLNNIDKLDPLTLRLNLKHPSFVFLPALASSFGWIQPVGYDPKKPPIGTGPFQFKSFQPGQQSTFVRNPNYFVEGQPYIDELVIIDFADDTARLNALIGGDLSLADQLPGSQVTNVNNTQGYAIVNSTTGSNSRPFAMRVDVEPFRDVRVRQALRLVVDRPQMIELAAGGYATLGNDLFARGTCDDSTLPQHHQDLEQVRFLLKAADAEGLKMEIVTAPAGNTMVESAQVFAQQASEAGISVSVKVATYETLYGDNWLSWPFAQGVWWAWDYLQMAASSSLPTSPFNETHWTDPRFTSLYDEANRTVDDAKRCEIVHEMQGIQLDTGGYIIPYFPNTVDGYSTKVAGLEESHTGVALNYYAFERLWFTS